MRQRKEQSNLVLIRRLFLPKAALTAYQVAEFVGLTVRNTRPYLKILHEGKEIYIVRYVKKLNGPAIPVYSVDTYKDAEDAPYPRAKSGAERMKLRRKLKCLTLTYLTM